MKILIVQIGRLGDMILTTPMFRAVKEKYPEAIIHVLASKKNFKILKDNKFVNKYFIYKKDIYNFTKLQILLRSEKYDAWIDPKDHFSSEGSLLAKLSNAKIKIGFNKEGSRVFDYSLVSDNENFKLHAVQRNLKALSPFGIETDKIILPDLTVYPEPLEFVENWLKKQSPKNKIVLNISTGDQSRYLRVKGWQTVIKYLASKNKECIIVFVDEDEHIAHEVSSCVGNAFPFRTRNIHDVIAIISKSDAVISPDTSIIHIASAFNIPTLGFFARPEWNENKFKPLGEHSISIRPAAGEDVNDLKTEEILAGLDSFCKIFS